MPVIDTAKNLFSRAGGKRSRPAAPRAIDTPYASVVDGALIAKLENLSLNVGRDLISGLMGEHQAQRRTTGIEFADYRAYNTGDDLRRVDWNAYARLGQLMVKQAQAEHDAMLRLLVDASPSMEFGTPTKFWAARRLAAGLGYIALAHLDRLVLEAPGATSGSHASGMARVQGRASAPQMFRYLDTLEVGTAPSFDALLTGWSADYGGDRIAVIISDLLLDGYREGVRRLVSSGFRVAVIQMLSPEELHPANYGDVELIDSETGQRLSIHLNATTLDAYRARLADWLAENETWCQGRGANYLLVQSDWDIERILLDILRHRGVTT